MRKAERENRQRQAGKSWELSQRAEQQMRDSLQLQPAATRKRSPGRPRIHQKPKVIGSLCPDRLYTIEGVYRATGLGKDSLRIARRAGVKPLWCGNRVFYRGRDLIAWIEGQQEPNQVPPITCFSASAQGEELP